MERTRAFRRHQEERVKTRRIGILKMQGRELTEHVIGKLTHTHVPCHCDSCNARKVFGDTLQERRSMVVFQDGLLSHLIGFDL